MTLSYTVSRADYQAFWWKSLFHWKAIKQIIFICLFFSVMVVWSDLRDFRGQPDWTELINEKLFFSTSLTVVSLLLFLVRWRTYPLFNGPVGKCGLVLKPDCFVLTDQNGHQTGFAITQMRFISQNRNMFFLYFGNRDGFPLPKNAFNDPALADRFHELMQDVKRNNLPEIAAEAIGKLF